MAVKDNDAVSPTRSQESTGFREAAKGHSQQQPHQQSQQSQTTPQGAAKFSFSELSRQNRGILGRNPASEILTKLTKALGELYGEGDQSYDVTLLPIDLNNNRALPLSVLAVCIKLKQEPHLGAAVHMLLLEGSAEPFTPLYEQIGQGSIEKLRVASDAYNPETIEAVFAEVARVFPQTKLMDASGSVVPRSFTVEDKAALHTLAANAAKATTTMLNTSLPNYADLNLQGAEKDHTLGIKTAFGQHDIADAAGNPVRAPVVVELVATSTAAPQQRAGQIERSVGVSRVCGFVDQIWAPVAQQQQSINPFLHNQQQQLSKQIYMARFVMTSLETADLLTLPAQLLAVAAGATLRENGSWYQSFGRTGFATAEADWHDIGMVNFEANLENSTTGYGARIKDTKADSFGPVELGHLIGATFRDGLVMSLDVSECGSDTWHNDVFAAAAEGTDGAIQAILNAATVLTNANFGQFFPVGAQVCYDEHNRIHMGTIMTKDGLRDIREFDYLAMLNLVAEKEPGMVRQWSDSFNRTDYSLDSRLAIRKKVLTAVFGDAVTFTGFARRVTFTDAFINALLLGIKAVGLTIRNNTQVADMGSFERATYTQNGALGGAAASGLFSYGSNNYGQQGQQGGQRPAGFQRWAR